MQEHLEEMIRNMTIEERVNLKKQLETKDGLVEFFDALEQVDKLAVNFLNMSEEELEDSLRERLPNVNFDETKTHIALQRKIKYLLSLGQNVDEVMGNVKISDIYSLKSTALDKKEHSIFKRMSSTFDRYFAYGIKYSETEKFKTFDWWINAGELDKEFQMARIRNFGPKSEAIFKEDILIAREVNSTLCNRKKRSNDKVFSKK